MPETRKTFNPGRWSGGHQRHPGKMPSIEKCDSLRSRNAPAGRCKHGASNIALPSGGRPPVRKLICMTARLGVGRLPSVNRPRRDAAVLKRSSPRLPCWAARSSPPPGRPWRTSEEAAAPCAQDAAIVRAFSALVLGRPRHRGRRQQAARSVDGGHGLTGSVQSQQMETFRSVNLSTLGTSRCASWFSKSERERSTRRAS